MAGDGFGSKDAIAQSTASGLPFAGVPLELRAAVDAFTRTEPDHGPSSAVFSHNRRDRRPVTLWSLLSSSRRLVVAVTLCIVVEVVCVQIGPVLTQLGIDRGIAEGSWSVLLAVGGAYLASVLVSMLAGRGRLRLSGRITASMVYVLRLRVFAHLQRLSLDFYVRAKAGVVMSRLTSDIENLQQMLQDGLVQFILQILTMTVVTVVLISYNATLAFITLLVVMPPLIALSVWFRAASRRSYDEVRDGIAGVLVDLAESLAGVRVVIASNRQRRNVAHHRTVTGVYRDANDGSARLQAIYGPTTDLIGIVGQIVVLMIGARMVLSGSLSVGELTAFVLYVNALFLPIQQLVQLYGSYQQGQASLRKIGELMATEPSVPDSPHAADLPPLNGHVELRNVTFGYSPDLPVLKNVDVNINPGETVCFVGPTGAGKSTVTKLITRFYDPTHGSVHIDGHDLRDVSLTSLRRQLGIVPQEPFLFVGTVRDNLAFGRPDASDAEVSEAVRLLGLEPLINRLPDRLLAPVHERGLSLSAGERQLFALARAFVAQPRLLVMDEATSNLDPMSELQVEHALDVLLEGRTAILVAHRLSTAMRADRIFVVDEGRVIESGSHAELVAAGGVYAGMIRNWETHSAHSST